ncbi:MAG: tetratricopeptide repeat protein, partial [Thalassobaculaceae bacterium]
MRDDNLRAMMAKAEAAHQGGDLAGAAAIYDAILTALPDQSDALHQASVVAMQAGRPDAAMIFCRRALVLAPATLGMANRLGLLLGHANQVAASARAFERAVVTLPSHPRASQNAQVARLLLSHAAAAAGDYETAIAHARRATRTAPARHLAWQELGSVAQQAEQLDLAARALRRAVILEIADPEPLSRLGFLAFGRHNIDRAERYFRFSTMVAPVHANAHVGRAECLAWR